MEHILPPGTRAWERGLALGLILWVKIDSYFLAHIHNLLRKFMVTGCEPTSVRFTMLLISRSAVKAIMMTLLGWHVANFFWKA